MLFETDRTSSLEFVLEWCASQPTCNGITSEGPNNKLYSARKGRLLSKSPSNEVSYVLDITLPCGGRLVAARQPRIKPAITSPSVEEPSLNTNASIAREGSDSEASQSARESLELYTKTMDYVKNNLIHEENSNNPTYMFVGSTNKRNLMDHLACFSGGMFALGGFAGAHGEDVLENERDLLIGEKITAACRHAYKQSPNGIGPEQMVRLLYDSLHSCLVLVQLLT